MNPWTILAVLVVLIGTHGTAYYRGTVNGENALLASQQQDRDAEAKLQDKQRKDADVSAKVTEDRLSKLRKRNATLQAEVNRYAQTVPAGRECLDADGVRLWQRAAGISDPVSAVADDASAGKPAVPSAP